jgi:hypothetical protein
MSEEPQIPRRYVAIRTKGSGKWRTVRAQVWDGIPGREGEAWLKEVRPVVRLDGENRNPHSLMGKVHAALEGAGLLSRAQKFVNQAYYLGSYDEVLRLAMEYVEVR